MWVMYMLVTLKTKWKDDDVKNSHTSRGKDKFKEILGFSLIKKRKYERIAGYR